MYKAILCIADAYILLCKIMVTITGHVFIYVFQMEHFSAAKFDMDYEKNMSFWKKKVEKIEQRSFTRVCRKTLFSSDQFETPGELSLGMDY